MIIFSLGYLVLLFVLALLLDLRRAYLLTSPLPMLVFFLPLLQLNAGAMSLVALIIGVSELVQARGTSHELTKLWIGVILSSLPILILLIVVTMDKLI